MSATAAVPDDPYVIYAAGLFDGEGCLFIEDLGSSLAFRVQLRMTFQPAVRRLHDSFGGSLRVEPGPKAHWSDTLAWAIFGPGAEAFLRRVRPYLHVKAAEADLFLACLDALALSGREYHTKWTDDQRAIARAAMRGLRRLKGTASRAARCRTAGRGKQAAATALAPALSPGYPAATMTPEAPAA